MFKGLIGTKSFYKRMIALMLPIMVQNGITNFVNMLDNIMVGQVGTADMTGVAVSNQLIFVFNLCVFGAISGAGIFGAQFYGKGDNKGLRDTLRFKLIFCTLLSALSIVIFIFGGESLINLYLMGEGSAADIAAALGYAKSYLFIMLIGILPYTIAQCYASTLRETGQTVVPMVSGLTAVVVNLILNYILIFGKLGAPALGVNGAAMATVISRFAELIVVVLWTHIKRDKNHFAKGLLKSLKVPLALTKQIIAKGLPLMLNETFWAAGVAAITQCYSVRGYVVIASMNISTTFYNVFSVAFMAVGMAIGIILGQQLGAGETNQAADTAKKSITFSVMISVIVGAVFALVAFWIPYAYKTTADTRALATGFMQIAALTMPLDSCAHAAYFTLRSGGKAFITIVFDSLFMWCISVPAAFILSSFTTLPMLLVYLICQGLNLIKCILGCYLVKKGTWIKNIVN